jgi:hypothetical protein
MVSKYSDEKEAAKIERGPLSLAQQLFSLKMETHYKNTIHLVNTLEN